MRPDLVRPALLGGATQDATAGVPLVGGVGGATAERRLLLAAAVESVRGSAGYLPPAAPAVATPAPPDAWPECSPRAAAVLAEIVDARPDLLEEAAGRLLASGRRMPAALLPEILRTVRTSSAAPLATALRPVLGERGRWLAALLGKDGAWAVVPDVGDELDPADERTWAEGSTDARAGVLAKHRRIAPDAAREWLAAVWKSERADERATFLQTLATALSLADEAFLEGALDDRSVAVRAAAARLLARLPGSAFAQRAEARAASLLVFTPAPESTLWRRLRGAAPKATLDAALPEEDVPKEWQRDGLVGEPTEGLGVRAYRLLQAIALVPPARWCERFGSTAPELVDAAASSKWSASIHGGWRRAAAAFGDAAWAEALWKARPARELLPAMSPEAAEAAIVALLAEDAPDAFTVAIERLPRVWSDAASRTALAACDRTPAAADVLHAIAPRLSHSSVADAIAAAERLALDGAAARRRDALVHTLRLRQRIHQEIVP